MEHCHTSASAKSDALAAIEARPQLSELSWPLLFTRAKPVEQTAQDAISPTPTAARERVKIAAIDKADARADARAISGHGGGAVANILPQYRRTAARMP